MTLIFLLLTIILPVFAQGDSTISPDSNLAAVLRLDGDGQFAALDYAASDGEIISILAKSQGQPLDLVLEVLAPDSRSLVYVDTPVAGRAEIAHLILHDAGTHIIRVNTFNGEGVGEVAITVSPQQALALTPDAPSLVIALGANETAYIALDGFDAAPENLWQISVRDPRSLLDPYTLLLDAENAVLAANDDHQTTLPVLNRFDSHLIATIPKGSRLQITEFMGRSGFFEISVTTQAE